MSSIMEKMSSESLDRPVKLEKRNFFLRSSSIQKIKCSATYPFRIAGSKLSREAIKQLIESLIIKARLFSQNALLILYVATLKVLGAIIPLSPLSTNDNVCDKLKETEKELTFVERILTRMVKLHVHKLEHQLSKKNQEIKKEPEQPISTEAKIETGKTAENKAAEISAAKRLFSIPEKTEPRKQNLMLIAVVYASAILIYIQLLALIIALNTAPTPPGLIFMVVSLSFIGYLVFKVLFQDRKRSSRRTINTRKNSRSKESSEEQRNKDSVEASRQNRFKTRRTFDFGGKTLSKIKML